LCSPEAPQELRVRLTNPAIRADQYAFSIEVTNAGKTKVIWKAPRPYEPLNNDQRVTGFRVVPIDMQLRLLALYALDFG
jgi:hypothetical protein